MYPDNSPGSLASSLLSLFGSAAANLIDPTLISLHYLVAQTMANQLDHWPWASGGSLKWIHSPSIISLLNLTVYTGEHACILVDVFLLAEIRFWTFIEELSITTVNFVLNSNLYCIFLHVIQVSLSHKIITIYCVSSFQLWKCQVFTDCFFLKYFNNFLKIEVNI